MKENLDKCLKVYRGHKKYLLLLHSEKFHRRLPIVKETCYEICCKKLINKCFFHHRDGDLGKIKNACENLVEQVKVATAHKQIQYDVFISYSHKNTEIATKMLSQLRETKKNLNIFFDYEELKTGIS